MFSDIFKDEYKRLNFENFVWGTFAFLCILNIYGDKKEKEYLETHNQQIDVNANYIFEITLIATFFIYIYFFIRNYDLYKKASIEDKEAHCIRLLGSCFLLAGSLCLIYFQTIQILKKKSSFF